MNREREPRDELLAEAVRDPQVAAHLRGVGEAGAAATAVGDGFGEALRAAPEELYVFDLEGLVVEVNDQSCRQLGYERDELLGMHIWELGTRQSPEGFRRVLTALEEEGAQFLFGHSLRKDGETYPVEARLWLAPFRGQPHVFALLRDALGEQGLIEERDQLISLIENSSEAIAVAAPDGTCSYMNPAGIEMLGLERFEDIGGRKLWELHPEHDQETVRDRVLTAASKGRWRGELVYPRHGGDGETPCLVNAFGIRHSQSGELIGLAVIAHDVSERKAVERHRERLLELNEVSRKVATSLLEEEDLGRAVEIILAGVGRILDVSRSFLCRYREDRRWVFRTHEWGADEGEIVPVEPKPESAGPYSWATDILVRGEVIRVSDVRELGVHATADSALLRSDVRAVLVMPVVIHGRLESFFGFVDTRGPREWEDEEFAILQIIVDSFARAVERRIAERERMLIARDLEKSVAREKDANRYKSEFLANMSHELRTPMNAIVGYAELLSRRNVDSEKQQTWIANIQKSTSYLLSLINDVLDLSKIEAGQMTIENERASLAEMVSSVHELLRGQAEEKLLELRTEYATPVPEFIETDPVRFKQILVNLVGNAIKFTGEGSVTVRVSMADSPYGGVKTLSIAVVDTGIGIGAEDLKRIFRPFSQLRAGRDGGRGGTGLGLDISRQLARLMGGEIEVESDLGAGSTFTFKLALRGGAAESLTSVGPAAGARAARAAREQAEESSLRGRRVLVVDDSPENREVLRFLLTEAGCIADTAENGALGAKLAIDADRSGEPYDAVLMDMNMPVLDGYEATKRILAAGLETPVIALTALAMAGDKDRCREAGCVDYVSKPVVPSAFLETLKHHLAGRDEALEAADEDALLDLVGNPRFAPLIRRYVASFPELAADIREHHRAGRLEELRTRVHRVRGTASNYGFPEISRAAGACEDAIRGAASEAEVAQSLEVLERLLLQVAREEQAS